VDVSKIKKLKITLSAYNDQTNGCWGLEQKAEVSADDIKLIAIKNTPNKKWK
jgi:hypothetical protein